MKLLEIAPGHRLDYALAVELDPRRHIHHAIVAENRAAIGQRLDLLEPVRHIDNRGGYTERALREALGGWSLKRQEKPAVEPRSPRRRARGQCPSARSPVVSIGDELMQAARGYRTGNFAA